MRAGYLISWRSVFHSKYHCAGERLGYTHLVLSVPIHLLLSGPAAREHLRAMISCAQTASPHGRVFIKKGLETPQRALRRSFLTVFTCIQHSRPPASYRNTKKKGIGSWLATPSTLSTIRASGHCMCLIYWNFKDCLYRYKHKLQIYRCLSQAHRVLFLHFFSFWLEVNKIFQAFNMRNTWMCFFLWQKWHKISKGTPLLTFSWGEYSLLDIKEKLFSLKKYVGPHKQCEKSQWIC